MTTTYYTREIEIKTDSIPADFPKGWRLSRANNAKSAAIRHFNMLARRPGYMAGRDSVTIEVADARHRWPNGMPQIITAHRLQW